MASKPKSRTFIVLHRGSLGSGRNTTLGRYKVGARNEKEAEKLVREAVGKHAKVRVYYQDPSKYMPHGIVVKEC